MLGRSIHIGYRAGFRKVPVVVAVEQTRRKFGQTDGHVLIVIINRVRQPFPKLR
jgi:hypothetical protein